MVHVSRIGFTRDHEKERRASELYERLRALPPEELRSVAENEVGHLPPGLARQMLIHFIIEKRLTEEDA